LGKVFARRIAVAFGIGIDISRRRRFRGDLGLMPRREWAVAGPLALAAFDEPPEVEAVRNFGMP